MPKTKKEPQDWEHVAGNGHTARCNRYTGFGCWSEQWRRRTTDKGDQCICSYRAVMGWCPGFVLRQLGFRSTWQNLVDPPT